MARYREAFVQASNLAFLWIFTGLWKVVWKILSRFILLQKGTDFLGPEGICTWRYSSQQRVMLSILQTELFQICSCLGNLHPIEPPASSQSCWTTFFIAAMLDEPDMAHSKGWQIRGPSAGLRWVRWASQWGWGWGSELCLLSFRSFTQPIGLFLY